MENVISNEFVITCDGYGYGKGNGLKSINGKKIYHIDSLPTTISHVRGNVAKGTIVNDDLTETPCYIVKDGDTFAHGETLGDAMRALTDKLFDDMTIAIDDSESYSPNKKGNDYSETFQLREYVPGDGIKQIHWKLSEKLDKLIVREASLPVQKSTLVFWDKYADDGFSSKEADAMAEVTASVCQALSKSGTPFSVGWNENKKCIIENINSTEELITAIPQLLKCGADTEMSGAKRYFENYGCAAFSKIIYISKTIPDGYYDFAAQSSITPILCSAVPIDGAVTFDTDSYSESLNLLELAI